MISDEKLLKVSKAACSIAFVDANVRTMKRSIEDIKSRLEALKVSFFCNSEYGPIANSLFKIHFFCNTTMVARLSGLAFCENYISEYAHETKGNSTVIMTVIERTRKK